MSTRNRYAVLASNYDTDKCLEPPWGDEWSAIASSEEEAEAIVRKEAAEYHKLDETIVTVNAYTIIEEIPDDAE